MFAGKVWHSELHQKGKVENESLGAPWTGERNVLNQWWDFLSIHLSSVAQDMRVGKKNPKPPKTRSAVWIASSSASSGSVRTRQMFSLASFLKTSRFSPWKLFALFTATSRRRGMRGCSEGSARWGPGLCLGHRVSHHEWVVLGCPPQLRGPWLRAGGAPTESQPRSRQHLARSGGLAASAEQAPACWGWEI